MIIKWKDSCKKMEQYTVQIYLVILAILVMSLMIGRFYWAYIAFYLGCSLYFVVQAGKFGERYQNSNRIVLGTILFFLISGVMFGMISSKVRTDYICLAMATMLTYIIIAVLSRRQM